MIDGFVWWTEQLSLNLIYTVYEDNRGEKMVRSSRDDAISEKEFKHLMNVAESITGNLGLSCRFLLICLGRLGLRAGELAHMRKYWVDWNKKHLKIPQHEPCNCGYCKVMAKQECQHSDGLTFNKAMEKRWHPKTKNSARTIPLSFNQEIYDTFKEFFEVYSEFPLSRIGVNRVLEYIVNKSKLNKDIYPHSLRATAAMWHAYKGASAVILQVIMGWSTLQTAMDYIRLAGSEAENELIRIHKNDKKELVIP